MAGTHFSGRTLSRSVALQLLFQAESTGRLVSEVLGGDYAVDQRLMDAYRRELVSRGLEPEEIDERLAEVGDYARQLALGCDASLHELDAVIGSASSNWSVSRMASVDRNLLRLALYEMLQVDEVDTAVAIDECVELAKAYGTDESSRFVNGLLGRVATLRDEGIDVVAAALAELAAREDEAAAAAAEAAADDAADQDGAPAPADADDQDGAEASADAADQDGAEAAADAAADIAAGQDADEAADEAADASDQTVADTEAAAADAEDLPDWAKE